MAKILNSSTHLDNDLLTIHSERKRHILKFIVWLLALFPFIVTFKFISFFIALLILVFFVIPNWRRYQDSLNDYNKVLAGANGEKKSINIYSNLPDSYSVISDLEIVTDGRKSQIDAVVIGVNGIFVIETKNINGYIYGSEKDDQITQLKVGRKGGEYSKTMYNPIKQVNTHVHRLSQYLKQNGMNSIVQGIVFFTNIETSVTLNSKNMPVFSAKNDGDREIINYIQDYNKNNISSFEKQKIEQLLLRCVIK